MAPVLGLGLGSKLLPELSTAMIPNVPPFPVKPSGLTPGFQPTIVPSSVAKRKRAGAIVGLLFASTPEIMNPGLELKVVILKTVPVGAPRLPRRSTVVGMLTTSGLMVTEFGAVAGTL